MDNQNEISGVLLINKHAGATSHDIVNKVRHIYNTKRVGHTGTLDPLATGVLVVLVGRAAKACEYLSHDRKKYRALLRLGLTTDTEDATGNTLTRSENIPSPENVSDVCRKFTGDLQQIPPMYSALKVNGQKLCDLARKGIEVERQPRGITIFSLDCIPTDKPDEYILDVDCSGGTYIRTLCSDIGAALGCGGIMAALERVETGGFPISDCVTVEQLKSMTPEQAQSLLLPIESLFSDLPSLYLPEFFRNLIRNGCAVSAKKLRIPENASGKLRLCDSKGHFFGLGEIFHTDADTVVKAIKIFDIT